MDPIREDFKNKHPEEFKRQEEKGWRDAARVGVLISALLGVAGYGLSETIAEKIDGFSGSAMKLIVKIGEGAHSFNQNR